MYRNPASPPTNMVSLSNAHPYGVASLVYTSDGQRLISGGYDFREGWPDYVDGSLKVWDTTTYECLGVLGGSHIGHRRAVYALALSPDGGTLASSSDDKTVKLWCTQTYNPLGTFNAGHSFGIDALAYSPNGQVLASADHGGTVLIRDTETGAVVKELRCPHAVHALSYSPDGKVLAAACCARGDGGYPYKDHGIYLWETKAYGPLSQMPQIPVDQTGRSIYTLAYHPDGSVLTSNGKLWDAKTYKSLRTLSSHMGLMGELDLATTYSPDGSTLVRAHNNGTLTLWDTQTHELLFTLGERVTVGNKGGQITSLAYRPDGKVLVSGSGNKTINFWDVSGLLKKPVKLEVPLGKVASSSLPVSMPMTTAAGTMPSLTAAFDALSTSRVNLLMPSSVEASSTAAEASSTAFLIAMNDNDDDVSSLSQTFGIGNPYYERANKFYSEAITAMLTRNWSLAHSLILQARGYLKDAQVQVQLNSTSFTKRERVKIDKRLIKIKERLMPQIKAGLGASVGMQ